MTSVRLGVALIHCILFEEQTNCLQKANVTKVKIWEVISELLQSGFLMQCLTWEACTKRTPYLADPDTQETQSLSTLTLKIIHLLLI